ncbi:MAG: hypothetical protein ACRC67_15660 [Inquilinus sp.]|uniref:hypothetical protein n=1 Tax=Inquilinus sp. TaxID=1932117 RepID=UPI003F3DD9EA
MPPFPFIPCRPQDGQPYGEINGYSLGRLAPELHRFYRLGGPMAPNSWIFAGAPPGIPRGVFWP